MNEPGKKKAPSRAKPTARGASLVLAAVLLTTSAAACASGNSPGPTAEPDSSTVQGKSTLTATPTTSAPPSAPAPTAGATNDLTGFGATQEKWNSTHKADTTVLPGSAYNPGFSTAGCSVNGDEYYAMQGTTFYSMCLPPHESQAAAQALVMREFPKDTAVLWQGKQTSGEPDECYQVEVHSSMLAAALGSSGNALIEFQTFEPGNSSGHIKYDASNANNVLLSGQDAESLSAAPGC